MSSSVVDVGILGAGPYGLSIAAHLGKRKISYRIFGRPMQSWQTMMPKGMLLKSDGFASSLYDPDGAFTLEDYCAEKGLPYAHVGIPVPLETFVNYGLEFQKRFVPKLEPVNIVSVKRAAQGFEMETENGEKVLARRVVIAAGITHFGYLPPILADLPREFVSHSSAYGDLSHFKGRKVAVLGGGSSAIDIAALLHEAGAETQVIARRSRIAFHDPPKDSRSLIERIQWPRSGLGLGWKLRFCTDAPLAFHALPQDLRLRIVKSFLGPAPGWFVREKVEGKIPIHLNAELQRAEVKGNQLELIFGRNGSSRQITVDSIISGTGYRVALTRLKFLDESLRGEIKTLQDSPVLGRNFDSSVPGLYFVGVASANSFGPLTRFAYGAKYTAHRISRHLAASR